MPILTLKRQPDVPLEAECLSPDVVAGKSPDDVRALPVFHGKRKLRLDEFFDVEGTSDDLELRGDLTRVKWVGKGMSRGMLTVTGNIGMHLGSGMKGGTIEVTGNAGDWIGAEMTGGLIRIRGNAGGQVGAAYRGSPWGMNRGTILIDGSAGIEVGMRMKRGIVIVRGPVRDFAGLQMKGGTLVLMGGAEIRTGAWMIRGTIVCLKPVRLLPTFASCCTYDPVFLRLYARHFASLGVDVPIDPTAGNYERFLGDAAVPGKGEILFWRPR
jgi:formylmethanofuran dehydrogenase subunit C